MCYEGAIESLERAKQKMTEKKYEEKGKAITKAQDIIEELISSLDFEKGGTIAENLAGLYKYILSRIVYADLKKEIGAIDEVVVILTELLSAWQELASKPDSEIQPAEKHFNEERTTMASGYVSV
jgi:flagellar protein FliS